jgi:hypothetical protein
VIQDRHDGVILSDRWGNRTGRKSPAKETKMHKRTLQFAFLIVFSMLFMAQSSFARNDVTQFRYGEKLVRIGDSKYDVITKIGGPVYVERTNVIESEIWVYEAKRTYYLTFANDRLQRIQIGRRVQ